MKGKELEEFKQWVYSQGGAHYQEKQNEAFRFKMDEIGIVYSSGKTSGEWTDNIVKMFRAKENYSWGYKDPRVFKGNKKIYEAGNRVLYPEDPKEFEELKVPIMKVKNFAYHENPEDLDKKINDWIDDNEHEIIVNDIVINTVCWPSTDHGEQHMVYSGYVKYLEL